MRTLKNQSLAQIRQLAGKLAAKHSGKGAVIGLVGNLGAGKTAFAKSFAAALGIKKVKSPTFIVCSQYEFAEKRLYHIDLYRLNRLDELQAIGLSDIIAEKDRIALIEWADKFPKILNKCDVIIKLEIASSNKRNVQIYNP